MYLIPDQKGICNLLVDLLSLGVVAVCKLLNSAWECFGLWNLHIILLDGLKEKFELLKLKPKHGGKDNTTF